MHSGLRHIHTRNRATKTLEIFPSPRRMVRWLDRALLVIAVIGPLVTIPQIIQVFQTNDSSNISPITWGSYMFFNLFWLAYGIVHKEKPIIITYILWLFANGTMLSTVFIF
jgi:uncharacterized protein with PQ loop repeat